MLCGALSGLLLCGCGAGGSSTSSTVAPSGAGTIAGLSSRVLAAGELARMAPLGAPLLGGSPQAWSDAAGLQGEPEAEAARLRSLGFRGAFGERLAAPGASTPAAESIVVRLGSARQALSQLAFEGGQEYHRDSAGAATPTVFAVRGIPGAYGLQAGSGTLADRTVAFTSGPYYYLVGATAGSASRGQLVAAALGLYRRAGG